MKRLAGGLLLLSLPLLFAPACGTTRAAGPSDGRPAPEVDDDDDWLDDAG